MSQCVFCAGHCKATVTMKTLLLDRDALSTTSTSTSSERCGLICGQLCEDTLMIVQLIPTPFEDDNAGFCWGASSPSWLDAHAVQVQRLLPGGLHIFGVFLASASSTSKHEEVVSRCAKRVSPKLPIFLQLYNAGTKSDIYLKTINSSSMCSDTVSLAELARDCSSTPSQGRARCG